MHSVTHLSVSLAYASQQRSSLIGQKHQLTADQQDRREENKTVTLWLLLHDGTSARNQNLPHVQIASLP